MAKNSRFSGLVPKQIAEDIYWFGKVNESWTVEEDVITEIRKLSQRNRSPRNQRKFKTKGLNIWRVN
jgi:phage terminase large subunit-like protein